jgi:flagellar basal-body rod modification protein FlgD
MSTTINNVTTPTWQTPAAASSTTFQMPSAELKQQDFLKLLVAQMTTQNPMSPMTDTDFLSQMVQMDSLERNRAMTDQLESMQDQQQFTQANALLGRVVLLKEGEGLPTAGVVTAVNFEDGKPRIVVGDKSYDLNQVIKVEENKEP